MIKSIDEYDKQIKILTQEIYEDVAKIIGWNDRISQEEQQVLYETYFGLQNKWEGLEIKLKEINIIISNALIDFEVNVWINLLNNNKVNIQSPYFVNYYIPNDLFKRRYKFK